MVMTLDQTKSLIEAMFLIGFLGAVAWDFVKLLAVAAVRAIASIYGRWNRIHQARIRALQSTHEAQV